MSVDITVDTKELDSIAAGIVGMRKVLDTAEPMSRLVQILGNEWDANFRSRGIRSGRQWAKPSNLTHRVRMGRGGGQAGFASEDPMLASGALWNVVTRPFKNWPLGVSERIGATVPPSGKPVEIAKGLFATSDPSYMVASISAKGRKFQATLTGGKALNQIGGYMPYLGVEAIQAYVPARPFWYFTQAMINEMPNDIAYIVINKGLANTPNFQGITTSRSTAGRYHW